MKSLFTLLLSMISFIVSATNITSNTQLQDIYYYGYHNTYAHFNEYDNNNDYVNDISYFLDRYRAIELDAWESNGQQYISHDTPNTLRRMSNCENDKLSDCLRFIISHVRNHIVDEVPLMLGIEVKWGFKQINDTVASIVLENEDLFYMPKDLMDHFSSKNDDSIYRYGRISLREGIRKYGWPTLQELNNKKIIIYYTGGGALISAKENNKRIGGYIKNSLINNYHSAGVGFPCPNVNQADQVYPHKYWIDGEGEKEYLVCNSIPHSESNLDAIAATSKQNNFLLRAWDSKEKDQSENYDTLISYVSKGLNIYENETVKFEMIKGEQSHEIPAYGTKEELLSGDTYSIKSTMAGCLEFRGGGHTMESLSTNTNCHYTGAQKYVYERVTKRLRIADTNNCLDVEGGINQQLQHIIAYPCHDGANQKWNLNGNNIESLLSGTKRCLDVDENTLDSFGNYTISLYQCFYGHPHQIFDLVSGD